MNELAKFLDLANHHPDSTPEQIRALCGNVLKFGFNAAFVNPFYIQLAKECLVGEGKVGTVISFPLGQETLSVKTSCAQNYASLGADELDVSLNVGYLKTGKWTESLGEMKAVVAAARSINSIIVIKFIPETGYLTEEEIKKTAEIMVDSGADFIKPCSSLGPRGPIMDDIKFVREAVSQKLKIKLAGGISTYDQAISFINAGADRIGTSHAVEIVIGASTQNPSGE